MNNFENFKFRLDAMQEKAVFFVTQRRKDIELYSLLSDCMAMCEEAKEKGFMQQIQQSVVDRASGTKKGRVYFESGADDYLVVGRYLFEDTKGNRGSAWRYTAALREAAKRGLSSSTLVNWLRENGGINTLFRGRPVSSPVVSTKTLHLNVAVTAPKEGTFTLTLLRDSRGFFDVVNISTGLKLVAA